jgi:hypothetical protein
MLPLNATRKNHTQFFSTPILQQITVAVNLGLKRFTQNSKEPLQILGIRHPLVTLRYR